jgi:pimeloyl-ACP methyl ester carboxylesterase
VIGHDWGGFTGLLLGLHHPERVDRLLLCSSPGPWAPLNPRVAAGLRRAWYADLTLEVVNGCSHWMPEERPDLIADQARARFG